MEENKPKQIKPKYYKKMELFYVALKKQDKQDGTDNSK